MVSICTDREPLETGRDSHKTCKLNGLDNNDAGRRAMIKRLINFPIVAAVDALSTGPDSTMAGHHDDSSPVWSVAGLAIVIAFDSILKNLATVIIMVSSAGNSTEG